MNKDLKNKLTSIVDIFIKEIKPEDDSMFTFDELMTIYENRLREYSSIVYGESKNDFTDEMLFDLKEGISPAVRKATDGTDEIITSILVIELQ